MYFIQHFSNELNSESRSAAREALQGLQGYLAHKNLPPRRTLQQHMPRAIWCS